MSSRENPKKRSADDQPTGSIKQKRRKIIDSEDPFDDLLGKGDEDITQVPTKAKTSKPRRVKLETNKKVSTKGKKSNVKASEV